ncbi:MAG: DUF4926 domain-containing protein [Hymenobacter sp.]
MRPGAAGALGTVVLVHAQGEAYEVEFIGLDGHTQAVLTLPAGRNSRHRAALAAGGLAEI